jgi:hypothetical protein
MRAAGTIDDNCLRRHALTVVVTEVAAAPTPGRLATCHDQLSQLLRTDRTERAAIPALTAATLAVR